jgi:hypothetical protein
VLDITEGAQRVLVKLRSRQSQWATLAQPIARNEAPDRREKRGTRSTAAAVADVRLDGQRLDQLSLVALSASCPSNPCIPPIEATPSNIRKKANRRTPQGDTPHSELT